MVIYRCLRCTVLSDFHVRRRRRKSNPHDRSVKQSSGQNSCDKKCEEKTGEIVLIDDQGRLLKIANQEKVAPHVGKKVKMMCKPVPGKEDTMYVDSLSLYGG